jgi:DNA topoisomerase-1
MRNLVIVEAAGKVDTLRNKLKAIGLAAEVVATVGHIADNPRSLNPIALDEQLRETAYHFRADRRALLDKIERAAFNADRIFIATDDDHEGDVIARDVARLLADFSERLVRVRLRAITEAELKVVFNGELGCDFESPAFHGTCRRIVDRAIGAVFTRSDAHTAVPVGRVQSSLLASLARRAPEVGIYRAALKLSDGVVHWTGMPVTGAEDLRRATELAEHAAQGKGKLIGVAQRVEPVSRPWGYEEVVAEAALRLHVDITQAAEVFQEAYERGLVSYPRVRAGTFTKDAVEVAAALAKQNRCVFDGEQLPLRDVHSASGHETPRPVGEDLMLGRPLMVLDLPEALAVLLARNVIECGQLVSVRRVKVDVDGVALTFEAKLSQPRKPWKDPESEAGFAPYPRGVALLRHMAREELGRPSTIVSHVAKFLQRGLLEEADDGAGLHLNARGLRWLEHARAVGFNADTSARMELGFDAPMTDPHARAREILQGHAMLGAIQQKARAGDLAETLDQACPEPF